MGYGLTKGAVWNPVKSYPRNAPCVCGSGKKFKKCCEQHQPLAIVDKPGETKEIGTFVKGMRKIYHK